MTSNYININGIKLHYFDTGGNKPDFLFIHGLHGHAAYIISLAEYISPLFRVIIPDLPGYGKSKEFPTRFSISGSAELLIHFIQKLHFYKFYVGGISMGGAISLEIIRRVDSQIRGAIFLQPFYSSRYIRKIHSVNKNLLLLLKLAKKPLLSDLITKAVLDNDLALTWMIRDMTQERLTDDELKYRMRNIRACTGRTYIHTVDSILSYKPPDHGYISRQKALILMDMDDRILDAQKTYMGYRALFPQHKLINIKMDNHNPVKKPTGEEIRRLFPNLLKTISRYFTL